MEPLRQVVLQEQNEENFNKKHIDAKIRKAIEENFEMIQKTAQGIELVEQYMSGQYYESKIKRIQELRNMDIKTLIQEIFIGVAYCLRPELFTSVTAQIAARLKFNDRREAITTVAELVAVLCITDAFDITKEDKQASLMVVSCIPLPQTVIQFIENSEYLPPMVCEPLELTHNFSSGYLTHNDSLILGTGNQHDGDICLDVLNTMNKVALKLDVQFLSTVEEVPTFETDDQDVINQWNRFKKQSYYFYRLMVGCGNRVYLTHKVDKRGRIYAQGYHITTQGTAFKKAMLELADEELVTGVPT
jgi:hypothetical protein